MPVVDTRQFSRLNKNRKRRNKAPVVMLLLAVFGIVGVLIAINRSDTRPAGNEHAVADSQHSTKKTRKKTIRQFTPGGFNKLALSIKYPNTQLFEVPPVITGDKVADSRIRKIAEARGYVMTSMPVGPIQKLNEPRLEGDDLLQPLAAASWHNLKIAAEQSGVPLSLISAYRSPEYQRNLFLSRLNSHKVSTAQIAAGQADEAVEAVLTQAAVPGYSRHHTGYTIDLWCEDGSGAFLTSSCFRWISADNYKIAKQNGWIPSYPDGVDLQGPEPEPWEYVWVGTDLVYE